MHQSQASDKTHLGARTIGMLTVFLFVSVVVTLYCHEYVHLGVAKLLGLPVVGIDWFYRPAMSPAVHQGTVR